MKRIAVVCSLLLALVIPVLAQEDVAVSSPSPVADPRVKALLDELGMQYEVDADGDYRAVFEFEGDTRSQTVIINSRTSSFDGLEIREVWSPAMESKGALAQKVANRLLQASFDASLGAWQLIRQPDGKQVAVFAVKFAADSDAETLKIVVNAVINAADEMERELTKKDVF